MQGHSAQSAQSTALQQSMQEMASASEVTLT